MAHVMCPLNEQGSGRRRLDRYLLYLQQYVLMKESIPVDVEFLVWYCAQH